MTKALSIFNSHVPNLIGRSVWDDIFSSAFPEPEVLVRRTTEGYPVTDIYRDEDDNQIIELALAGFKQEDLSIEVKDGHITVSADKTEDAARKGRRIAKRSFKKTFVDHSNKLDLHKSDATFEDGLLRITVPPVAEAKPLFIDIK